MAKLNYTINEVARKFNLSAHALRYYDKEGLLPFIGRDKSGNRIFTDSDLDWVTMICCLKDTGMPIKEIKTYSHWCQMGKETVDERKKMLAVHRLAVEKQINQLRSHLKIIDNKVAMYDDPEYIQILELRLERRNEK
jgi:DNA-binding transcriptional MerR regulator